MPPASTAPFSLAVLVASANGHRGTNDLDWKILARALRAGSTRSLAGSQREQIHEILKRGNPELIQHAWQQAGGRGNSLERLAREAAGTRKRLPGGLRALIAGIA
jgi:hypothetical protein